MVEKREQLKDELQLIDQYQEVLEYLAEPCRVWITVPGSRLSPFWSRGGMTWPGPKQELNAALADRFLLVEASGGLIVAVIITLKRDAEAARGILAHEGLRELPRLGEYARMDLTGMAARLTAKVQSAPGN